MKLTLKDRWDDLTTGDRYLEIKIGKAEACCVKNVPGGLTYVMMCYDNHDVYSDIGGADFPLRSLSQEEYKEILDFAREQLAVEEELDRREMEA